MNDYIIHNLPDYANDYEFIVAAADGENLWFYGAYRDGFKAAQIAEDIGGVVAHNVRIQGVKS